MTAKTWCEMSKATLAQGVAESSAKPESGESLWLPEAAHTGALFGWTVRISEDLPLGMIRFFRQKGIETVFYTATVEALRVLRNPFARIAEELCERMAETQSAKEAREKAAFESLLIGSPGATCVAGPLTVADLQALNRALRKDYDYRAPLSSPPRRTR